MLRQLMVRDFRNLQKLDVDVPRAGFVIIGDNGHGKTNLLEAVSYLALFRSVRGARDTDVIRFGAPAFHVRAQLAPPSAVESVSIGYERATKRKKVTLDGVEQSRLSTALGALPSVCFSPGDATLVSGGPAERRYFLDVTLALAYPRYLQALQHYRAAVRQRNAALRSAHRGGVRPSTRPTMDDEARIAVWEPSLSRHGAVLAAMRRQWCETHAERFAAVCAAIGERSVAALRYATSTPSHDVVVNGVVVQNASVHETTGQDAAASGAVNAGDYDTVVRAESNYEASFAHAYAEAFQQQRTNEMRRGLTLVGPHRDDLALSLGHRELRTFGSAGQQRTAAIALRMLELETLRETLGAPPLLLLDDPFAELDARRSARILTLLEESGVGQVLMAVPRAEDIPAAFTKLERRVMRDGELQGMSHE